MLENRIAYKKLLSAFSSIFSYFTTVVWNRSHAGAKFKNIDFSVVSTSFTVPLKYFVSWAIAKSRMYITYYKILSHTSSVDYVSNIRYIVHIELFSSSMLETNLNHGILIL